MEIMQTIVKNDGENKHQEKPLEKWSDISPEDGTVHSAGVKE
jgi:hypothetical protein